MEAYQAAREAQRAIEAEMASKKIEALQRAGRGIVDTEGESVVDSDPKE